MKLSILGEGHWKTISQPAYGMDKKADSDMSMLLHPEDRDRFIKWGQKPKKKKKKSK